jgi:flagellar assembly protein FliH
MISLSRLIKSHVRTPGEIGKKVISIKVMETDSNESDHQPAFTRTEEERVQILMRAQQEAEMILSNAKSEARLIHDQVNKERQAWEKEREALAEDAKAVGYERGLEEGQKSGYEEYRQLIQLACDTVEASKLDYYNHIESSEKVILDLGIIVAGKIIGKKISGNKEDFLSLVKRALKNARDYKDIQLHIHPNYYQFMLAQKEELVAIFPKEIDFYIFPDDELSEESCIIESENGRIDASVDSQLEEIKKKLFEMLESEQ